MGAPEITTDYLAFIGRSDNENSLVPRHCYTRANMKQAQSLRIWKQWTPFKQEYISFVVQNNGKIAEVRGFRKDIRS